MGNRQQRLLRGRFNSLYLGWTTYQRTDRRLFRFCLAWCQCTFAGAFHVRRAAQAYSNVEAAQALGSAAYLCGRGLCALASCPTFGFGLLGARRPTMCSSRPPKSSRLFPVAARAAAA